jgi:hypothetical protein
VEGGGGRARPAKASQAGNFLLPPCKWPTYVCASYIHNVSILNTEWRDHLKSVVKYITFRRRKLLQGRGVRGQSSHPKGGILLIICDIGSQPETLA